MFLTGEFSQIARVTKRQLHYYNRIGLFSPEHIDPQTGYRYYSTRQLPHLNRILALKDMGLSLGQIKKMLQVDISDDEIQGMFMLKKAELEQTVLEDWQRLRRIEARLQQNQVADDPPDVVIKSIAAQLFLSVRATLSNEEEVMQLIEQILHVVPARVGSGILGAFAGIVYSDAFMQAENDMALGYFIKKAINDPISLAEDCVLRTHKLPAVETMVTSVLTGGPDPMMAGLGKIGHWIEANGYRMAGPYREIGYDVASPSDLETAVIEIQMPVDRVNPVSGMILNFSE